MRYTHNDGVILVGTFRELFTPQIRKKVGEAYPKLVPYLDIWLKDTSDINHWRFRDRLGEAPSVWRDFQRFVAKLISRHPAFHKKMKDVPGFHFHKNTINVLQRNNMGFEPWRIISKPELERLSDILSAKPILLDQIHPETKFVYSAASLALDFLSKCTRKVRNRIRKIILMENEMSGGKSECHGRGFIAFCQENRNLHVERRLNLWRTVLEPDRRKTFEYTHGWTFRNFSLGDFQNDRLHAKDITESAGKWMTEAMALPSLGMPEGSYTLVFDGDPIPKLSSEVFRIIQRDAAWQAALDTCYSRGLVPEVSWLDRRMNHCYKFEGLPEVMQMLLAGNSLIRCNFDLGEPYDIEEIIEKHRGYDWEAWHRAWKSHEPSTFQTEPPLPPWHEWCWLRHFHF